MSCRLYHCGWKSWGTVQRRHLLHCGLRDDASLHTLHCRQILPCGLHYKLRILRCPLGCFLSGRMYHVSVRKLLPVPRRSILRIGLLWT